MSAELFARYAFPPNELGYCGPPDSSVLLRSRDDAELLRHARGFDGAWPYLEELAAAAGLDPLDTEVVRSYWVGGALLDRVDGHRLLSRLDIAMAGQPTGLLNVVDGDGQLLAHHSFHVFVVYPWVRFLESGPATPMRILQACRIRWGVVSAVDGDQVVIETPPLEFDGHRLFLGAPRPETVRWRRGGVSLVATPRPGQTVSAHWDWVCDVLDDSECHSLAAATATTLSLVNQVRGHSVSAPPQHWVTAAPRVSPGATAGGGRRRR